VITAAPQVHSVLIVISCSIGGGLRDSSMRTTLSRSSRCLCQLRGESRWRRLRPFGTGRFALEGRRRRAHYRQFASPAGPAAPGSSELLPSQNLPGSRAERVADEPGIGSSKHLAMRAALTNSALIKRVAVGTIATGSNTITRESMQFGATGPPHPSEELVWPRYLTR
jgi:hypothetical protein